MIILCTQLLGATVTIVFLLLPTSSTADCIGCFDVIKVRAEFRDGASREMYLVHYPSASPLQTDSDSSLVVPLEEYDTNHYFNGKVPLLRAIYQFEGITTATTQADIDSIDVSSLSRLVYLQDMRFGAWGSINVYPTRTIELLHKTPTARYEYDDAGTYILLAYDPQVKESDLKVLVDLRDWEHSLGDRLRANMHALCQTGQPATTDNSVEWALSDELNILYERLFTLDTLVISGPVGKYLSTIRARIVARLDYLKAVRSRFGHDRDATWPEATAAINRILGSAGCDTTRTLDYARSGRTDSLFCEMAQCPGIWLDNESDYTDFLETTDVIEVMNGSD